MIGWIAGDSFCNTSVDLSLLISYLIFRLRIVQIVRPRMAPAPWESLPAKDCAFVLVTGANRFDNTSNPRRDLQCNMC